MWPSNQQLVDIAREYMTQHILFADAYLKAFLLDNECLDCGKVMSVVFWWQQQIFLFNPLNSVVRITDVCVHLLCIWQRLQTRQPENVISYVVTWAYRARESSVTQKSAITDHAAEENHVIDLDKAKVVDGEAQRQTRWIKEAFWSRKTPTCMNWDTGSYQLSHICDQVISRSNAPLNCKQSTRHDQDVRRTSKRCNKGTILRCVE